MGIWDNLLCDNAFRQQLSERGYSGEIKFTEYVQKYKLEHILQRSGAITAGLLSIDFFSRQSKDLVRNNMFLLRVGQGKFVVMNLDFFYSAYLDLKLENYEEIQFDIPDGFENLSWAYKEGINENACLELMHFLGVYKIIISRICGEQDYFIGPRGNRTSKFDVYFKNKKTNSNLKIFTYFGQEELDYSLYTKNAIFVLEAKNMSSGGLDLGWHKIAYPIARFRDLKAPKFPCYFLKQKKTVWIFVFPPYSFYKGGILLNDQNEIVPQYTFRINLNNL